jgi:hypothetical protein
VKPESKIDDRVYMKTEASNHHCPFGQPQRDNQAIREENQNITQVKDNHRSNQINTAKLERLNIKSRE